MSPEWQRRRSTDSAGARLASHMIEVFETLAGKVEHMSAQLDDLTAAVAAEHDAATSAITLLNGLAAKIDELVAAGTDPAALQALADAIRSDTVALSAAVATDARP